MQSHRTQKTALNQDCAEQMLIKAAAMVNGIEIDFNYPSTVNDEQLDVSAAMVITNHYFSRVLTSGKTAETLKADLASLDKSKAFFMRTGTNNGAGHWRFMYFDVDFDSWILYSSPTNQYAMTDESYQLSQQAIDELVVPHGRWGDAAGEHSILLQEASDVRVIHCANYLYDLRTSNQAAADECLFANKDACTLYPQLKPKSREEKLRDSAAELIQTLTAETERLKKSKLSFLFRYEINTKQIKIDALKRILAERNLEYMQRRAADCKKNNRIMRSKKTDRTRRLINEMVVIERFVVKNNI